MTLILLSLLVASIAGNVVLFAWNRDIDFDLVAAIAADRDLVAAIDRRELLKLDLECEELRRAAAPGHG